MKEQIRNWLEALFQKEQKRKQFRKVGVLSGRKIWYSNKINELQEKELKNWLFLPIVENLKDEELDEIAKWSLDKKAIFACCLGAQCEKLHDYIDEYYAFRELKYLEGEIPDVIILTTWHFDFEEGFWFATIAANHPDAKIENVVCLDLSSESKENELKKLIRKIKNGWLPED